MLGLLTMMINMHIQHCSKHAKCLLPNLTCYIYKWGITGYFLKIFTFTVTMVNTDKLVDVLMVIFL